VDNLIPYNTEQVGLFCVYIYIFYNTCMM